MVHVGAARTEAVVRKKSMVLVMDPLRCWNRFGHWKGQVEGMDLATYTVKGQAVQ